MTFSRVFLYFCLAFIGGIFAASFIFLSQFILLGFLIAGIFLFLIFGQNKKLVVIGFSLFFFVLGIWRYQSAESKIIYPTEGNVTLTGVVVKEPDIRPSSIKLSVKTYENGSRMFLVTAGRYPEYKYGDKLKIIGLLKKPPVFDDFNYRDYLKKDGIVAVMDFPKIELIGQGSGNPVMKAVFSFKNKFQETVRTFISPPQEGFLEALAFGEESNISKEWKEKLNLTGTRHIAAVSGMNITIISSLFFSFILKIGLRKNQAFYFSIILLFLYILMIGAPASAVRAFIMAGLWLLAEKLGRQKAGSRVVLFAGTFMLAQNPFLLIKDVGFQLSFLAILGIIYLQPFFTHWLSRIPNPGIFPIRIILAATLSAQVFTMPILIYNFGYVSLISLAANILIVPVLAPITILIFLFGISGMIFNWLGFILSLPVWFSLTYIVKIIDFASKFSFASLTVENLHWVWPPVFYLFLGGFIWWYNRYVWKQAKEHGW